MGADEWISTQATIVSCEETAVSRWFKGSVSEGSFEPKDYVVTFSYLALGRMLQGSYRANSPQVVGNTFEVTFNPSRPEENSALDPATKPWVRLVLSAIGITLTCLFLWISKKFGWEW